jgi:predicted PurR-regulated permease PerM
MVGAYSAAIRARKYMTTDRRRLFDVSWRAIAKVIAAVALVWAWFQLWQFVMVIVVAIIIAVALDPLVRYLEQHRVPRWLGAFGSVLVLAAIAVGMIAASWVSITEQSRFIIENLTRFYRDLRGSFPAVERLLPTATQGGLGQYALSFGRSAANAVGMFVVALVLTVYLLIEWKATLEWLIAFVPQEQRTKVRRTLAESRTAVFSYVVGNALTSVITAVATFIALLVLKVPAAMVLAIIAGLFDFIPVVGFLLSLGITALLAATVSTTAVIGVIVFYFVFNAVENYFIVPKIYGRELQLSKLAVLIAVAIGGQLGGVIGALLALPIAAVYPIVERIWLRDRLGADTVDIHTRLSA